MVKVTFSKLEVEYLKRHGITEKMQSDIKRQYSLKIEVELQKLIDSKNKR